MKTFEEKKTFILQPVCVCVCGVKAQAEAAYKQVCIWVLTVIEEHLQALTAVHI